MEKKERNEERKDIGRRKGIPEGREPRGAEGLVAVMERRTRSPKREARTELRDRQAERHEKENSRGDAQGSVLSVRQEMKPFRENRLWIWNCRIGPLGGAVQ